MYYKDSGTDFITRKNRPGMNSQFLVDSKFVIRDVHLGMENIFFWYM